MSENSKLMQDTAPPLSPNLSRAEQVGLVVFLIAALLLFIDTRLSVIALAGFLLICLVAPFFPGFSFYLPIISRGNSGKMAVALTFDDGPDPISTPELLHILSRHSVKATFFVTGEKVSRHPELVKRILIQGHSIGNHTYTHDNLILLKSSNRLLKEIQSTQNELRRLGIISLAFRPPVGITNPRLWQVLRKLDLYTVNFSCRAYDFGNRRIKGLSKKILKCIRPDDIIVLHDVRPQKPFLFTCWLNEIEEIMSGIKAKGLEVLPLAEVIDKPVMATTSGDIGDINGTTRPHKHSVDLNPTINKDGLIGQKGKNAS